MRIRTQVGIIYQANLISTVHMTWSLPSSILRRLPLIAEERNIAFILTLPTMNLQLLTPFCLTPGGSQSLVGFHFTWAPYI